MTKLTKEQAELVEKECIIRSNTVKIELAQKLISNIPYADVTLLEMAQKMLEKIRQENHYKFCQVSDKL